jgi:hypothetical protein
MLDINEAKKFYMQILDGAPKEMFLQVDHEIRRAIQKRYPHTYISTVDLNTISDLEKYLKEAGFQFKSWLHHTYNNNIIIITTVWGWAEKGGTHGNR